MACSSCGAAARQSYTQIVKNDGGSLPTLKYLHCKYQDQFEFIFGRIGISATEASLPGLAYAYDTGSDKKGIVKDKNNQPIYFSVEDELKKIDTSRPGNNFCSI